MSSHEEKRKDTKSQSKHKGGIDPTGHGWIELPIVETGAQTEDGFWWTKEIPRLQAEIRALDLALTRATYGPASRKITKRMGELQGELDNARLAAKAHAQGQRTQECFPAVTQEKSGGASSSTPLPGTWAELLDRSSISQREAAQFLKRGPRTIRRRVQDKELTRSQKGRIVCDERLRNQIRKVHGRQVLP